MATSTPTRDRIIEAAMSLFGDNGFRGTSVAQIEAAAGLTPGAGGLYHHFRSKEEVLTAGIDRHLDRLSALRDIRRLFTGLGDTRAELTMTARYALTELDNEAELLRILASESRARPALVQRAVTALVDTTHAEFAAWLHESRGCPPDRAAAIAAVGLGSLLSNRLLRGLLGTTDSPVDDDTFIATWVEMIYNLIAGQR
ncbi:MAG TPA: TetR/AcrR family transcriptional regulator [Actinophytocola sp.]|uniref:TetR/AcrR family transcriptional regulator n=1 Tax=Actinophytocola sp. TaxID=1872138 RepID=UPI002DDDBD43|nr:TetR/AcrR family transcriptional regulator [Actinophytocola sp.]HEV2782293.1 TetR/AcrR family transcriptional regulator [Actinophytocola sp.]